VEVSYFTEGKLKTVRAANCILACWHVVIPYIAQELPDAQKEALAPRKRFRCSTQRSCCATGAPSKSWARAELCAQACITPASTRSSGQHRRLRMHEEAGRASIVVHMMKAACKPDSRGASSTRWAASSLFDAI